MKRRWSVAPEKYYWPEALSKGWSIIFYEGTRMRAQIHIGKHKTGTTSFQKFLSDHSLALEEHGYVVIPTRISNLVVTSVIRKGCDIPPIRTYRAQGDDISVSHAQHLLRDHISNSGGAKHTILLSNEHISYFRQETEVRRFLSVIDRCIEEKLQDVEVALVVRSPSAFLKSYKKQIIDSGIGESSDSASPYYCGEDSWLVDDPSIQALWSKHVHSCHALKYEGIDTVEALVKAFDLPIAVPRVRYWNNSGSSKRKNILRRLLRAALPSKVFYRLKKTSSHSN